MLIQLWCCPYFRSSHFVSTDCTPVCLEVEARKDSAYDEKFPSCYSDNGIVRKEI